ncbi:MAG: CRISPR-associated protein Cas4 [Bacillota bacterium]
MAYDEEDCLPLSGIQHLAFCRRQFALIHIERLWAENTLTFDGREMHDRADDPFFFESRGTTLVTRSVPLLSRELGLYGVADVVEFHKCVGDSEGTIVEGRDGRWQPYPIEYKRGQPKPDDRDLVQVCAQAMCLEEMLGVDVREGALYYGRTRRRQAVMIDDVLRKRVVGLACEMHRLYDDGHTPLPIRTKACDNCSLANLCLPKLATRRDVRRYVQLMSKDARDPPK